ncbi:unnamed protein product [Rotaria sp. Silwood2]|nr:unnamed protein product [Rotaria sp. Silwood2]CAF4194966.1 unnamed protein product [Rotaria sp. Silwood2]
MSNSNFKYLTSDFPPMPMPQFVPTNLNNTMLIKLDDLLGKITEVNNHLSNLELKDGKKAEILLQWADEQFLAQALPSSPTSLRCDRVIDYAFVRGLNLDIQVYNGNTTSDHLPILSVIPLKVLQQKLGKNTHWKSILPSAWKDTRMILLAKKDSICPPSLTRPISLLDSLQKIGEKLFLTRFRDLLFRRGLLPNSQSGFRERFHLQTRLLLFLEAIYSLMSNSAPVCTIFVDFRAAFDQLWFLGCVEKLRNLGILSFFLNWIESWLNNRRCFIEINGSKSCWFSIEKGGPQGSVFTPTLFITYNCDMGSSLSGCISHFFADDLAGIMAGQLGINYSSQCLDLEKRVKVFLDQLEYYSCLTDQPINLNKTEAMFSARAIGHPNFVIQFRHGTKEIIKWVPEYKYLGYLISSKLGWDLWLFFSISS